MTKCTYAISIRQPYAELIMLTIKKHENRSTLTHLRGRVYVYASKKPAADNSGWRRAKKEPGGLPTGVIVGSVEIVDCKWSDSHGCFRYRLTNPVRLRKAVKPLGKPQPKFFKPRL